MIRSPMICFALVLCLAGGQVFAQAGGGSSDEAIIDLSPLLSQSASQDTDDGSIEEVESSPASLPLYVRTSDTAAATQTRPRQVFVPLQSGKGTGIQRLSGEYAELPLTLDLPLGTRAESLVLTYRTSINVLPEGSSISVIVNGVEAAQVEPAAFDGFVEVTVGTGALTSGLNQVILRVEHSHRIFCGPEASFQIWSEFDLGRSGVRLAENATTDNIARFRIQMTGTMAANDGAVTIVAATRPEQGQLDDLAQRLSALLPGVVPKLRLQDPYGAVEGALPSTRIAIVDTDQDMALIRETSGGGLVLVLGPRRGDALAGILSSPLPPEPLVQIVPGRPNTLTELGHDSIEMHGRYERSDLRIILPEDWLLNSGQLARLELVYSYVSNLPEGSLMLVKVNDTTVRLLPLFGNGGETLPPLSVGFPARLLGPGANEISFETLVPGDPPDLPCPVIDGALVEVLPVTTLTVPTSPRMQFPDLGRSLSGAWSSSVLRPGDGNTQNREDILAAILEITLPQEPAVHNGPPDVTLEVLRLDQVAALPTGFLQSARPILEAAVSGQSAAPTGMADLGPLSYGQRFAQFRDQVINFVYELALPGDPPLPIWLDGKSGVALLMMPDATQPNRLVLMAGAGAELEDIGRAVAFAKVDPAGPRGQVALLGGDGTWQSWSDANQPPVLLEPLTLANFRTVAGTYASWAPLYFIALLAGLIVFSVPIGVLFVIRSRGKRA